jgi:hypothetical protein
LRKGRYGCPRIAPHTTLELGSYSSQSRISVAPFPRNKIMPGRCMEGNQCKVQHVPHRQFFALIIAVNSLTFDDTHEPSLHDHNQHLKCHDIRRPNQGAGWLERRRQTQWVNNWCRDSSAMAGTEYTPSKRSDGVRVASLKSKIWTPGTVSMAPLRT